MSDTDREKRIRERAYYLWQAEGCPEGRAAAHWDLACRLEAQQEDAVVDEASEESFPASDPPAHVPITGERV